MTWHASVLTVRFSAQGLQQSEAGHAMPQMSNDLVMSLLLQCHSMWLLAWMWIDEDCRRQGQQQLLQECEAACELEGPSWHL